MPPPLPTMPVEEKADDLANGPVDADDAEEEDDNEDPEEEVVESEVPEKNEENPEAFGDFVFFFKDSPNAPCMEYL